MERCVRASSPDQSDLDKSCPVQDEIRTSDLESQLVKALTCRSEGSEMIAAADIARICGVSERHVMNMRKRRQMPPGKQFGRVWRWHARTVAQWLVGSATYDASTAAMDLSDSDDRCADTCASQPRPRHAARSAY